MFVHRGRNDVLEIVGQAGNDGDRRVRRHCSIELIVEGSAIDSSYTTGWLERCSQRRSNSDEIDESDRFDYDGAGQVLDNCCVKDVEKSPMGNVGRRSRTMNVHLRMTLNVNVERAGIRVRARHGCSTMDVCS